MTREDAKAITNLMSEKEDYELIISKEKDSSIWDYNTVLVYAWSTKNDETNTWEHSFQDVYEEDYSEEEIIEKLMCCDKYMVLDTTKTVFVWQTQDKKNGG